MQHYIITIALFFTSVLFAQERSNMKIIKGQEITVTLLNASSDEGTLNFSLFNENTFMKSAPLFSENVKIIEGKGTVVFKNIPKGEYAIICYHDENNNKRIDFLDNGMPKENYGTSNNPLSYGPPNYEDSKFLVKNEAISLEIKF